MSSGNIACRKCEVIIGDNVEQEKKLCIKVREFTYLCDRVSKK